MPKFKVQFVNGESAVLEKLQVADSAEEAVQLTREQYPGMEMQYVKEVRRGRPSKNSSSLVSPD